MPYAMFLNEMPTKCSAVHALCTRIQVSYSECVTRLESGLLSVRFSTLLRPIFPIVHNKITLHHVINSKWHTFLAILTLFSRQLANLCSVSCNATHCLLLVCLCVESAIYLHLSHPAEACQWLCSD